MLVSVWSSRGGCGGLGEGRGATPSPSSLRSGFWEESKREGGFTLEVDMPSSVHCTCIYLYIYMSILYLILYMYMYIVYGVYDMLVTCSPMTVALGRYALSWCTDAVRVGRERAGWVEETWVPDSTEAPLTVR